MSEPRLHFWIAGRAKPKGSLNFYGKGRVAENVAGSGDWRTKVWNTAHGLIKCCDDPACAGLLPGFPITEAVEIHLWLFFDRPKSAPRRRRILPITRSTGDVDKLARNCLDALADARVIHNDSQVVTLVAHKRYCEPWPDGWTDTQGARIAVYEVDPEDSLPPHAEVSSVRGRGAPVDGVP